MSGTSVLLAVLAAVLAGCLFRAIWEPTRLDTTRIRLTAGEGCRADQSALQTDQPENSRFTLRILFFSDLHMDALRLNPAQLLSGVRQSAPDLILFAGDLTARQDRLPAAVALISRLHAENDQVPLLTVPGNHDTDEGLHALETAGAIVLQNSSYILRCRGTSWQIIGLEDNQRGTPDAPSALHQLHRTQQPDDGLTRGAKASAAVLPQRRLVLVHNPDTLISFPPGQAASFCAGHFHGGQIWLPFRMEFLLLRQEKLPRIGLYKGCICWGDMVGYINRGLGCVLLPLRFRSLPELTCISLIAPEKPVLPADKTNGGSNSA